MKFTKKAIEVLVLVAVIAIVIFLPFNARTKSYPLAIVNGNSMFPNLQNGDLVYYSGTDTQNIPNGTIIVFLQGATGDPLLDSLVRPVVIHRVIGEVIQDDGTVCYETKGDNNEVKDPFLTKSDQVLGVATQSVPKVGLLLLFLQSPQGLIATIGIISLGYLSLHDMKRKEEKKKEKLLAALSKKVLNGDLQNNQFEKLELAIKYSDEIESFGIKDPSILAFVGWLKNGGLDQNWKVKNVICYNCSGLALELKGERNNSLAICPHCHNVMWNTTMVLTEKIFNKVLLESIDEALSSLGDASKVNLYSHLETAFTMKKKEIPSRLDDFSFALERILGKGSTYLNLLLIANTKKKLSSFCHVEHKGSDFQEYVKKAKECVENMEKERRTQTIGNTPSSTPEDYTEILANV